MSAQAISGFVGRHRMAVAVGLVAGLLLAAAPMVVRSFSASPGAAPAQAPEVSKPSLRAQPAFIKIPDERRKGPKYGLWLLGSGYEPGQELDIRFKFGGVESSVSGMLVGSPAPNDQGAFAAGFEVRPRFSRLAPFAGGGPVSFRVYDLGSGELLASAPVVICDPTEEELDRWCGPATDILPLGPVSE